MSFQISRVVLYSHRGLIRSVEFRLDQLNIISGDSGTGKSAIIDILDYCMASKACAVPAGVIRDQVAWFAAEFVLEGNSVFVARRCPEPGQATSNDVFIEYNPEVIPAFSSLSANTNRSGLQDVLTGFAQIERTVDPTGTVGTSYNATVRHASHLLFQTQNEISNRQALFHGQADNFVRTSIRDTLPYFVGAVDAEDFTKAARLYSLRRLERKLRAELRDLQELSDPDGSRATELVGELVAVGMIPETERPETRDEAIRILRSVNLDVSMATAAEEADGRESNAPAQRRALQNRLFELRAQRAEIQEKLSEAETFGTARTAFDIAAHDQISRLGAVEIVQPDDPMHLQECPLCSAPLEDIRPSAAAVRQSMKSLREAVRLFAQDPPQLRALIGELRAHSDSLDIEIAQATQELVQFEQSVHEWQSIRNRESQRALTMGRVSLFLESVADSNSSSLVREQLIDVTTEISRLDADLDQDAVAFRLAEISRRISQLATELSRELTDNGLEWIGYPLKFDPLRLTVVIETPGGDIAMDSVGSGATWVSEHLLAHLALHVHLSSTGRPVPRFLVIDQPSQAYFPTEFDLREARDQGARTGDLAAAERLLKLSATAIARSSAPFQVILTDHASFENESWFDDALVHEWRDGEALVPSEWID